MLWKVVLIVIAVVVTAVGTILGPFLLLKRLAERAEINGMVLVKDGMEEFAASQSTTPRPPLIQEGNLRQAIRPLPSIREPGG